MKRTAEEMDAPPSSTSISFLQINSSSTNRTILHQQQQIESLQVELDHERDRRRLDKKKSNHSIDVLQEQLSLLKAEMKQMQALFDEASEHNEKRIQQLTDARDKALHMNRQYQIQIEQMEEEQFNPTLPEDENTPMTPIQKELLRHKVLNERLAEQIQSYADSEVAYQTEITNLKSTVQQKLLELKEISALESKKHPLLEEAPPTVMQELNRCRLELSNRDRQIRQLERKHLHQNDRCNALLRENEGYQIQLKRYPVIQAELQLLHQQHAKQEAELNSWNEFSMQMNNILRQSPFYTEESSVRHGPPEISTILRFIETNRKREATWTIPSSPMPDIDDTIMDTTDISDPVSSTKDSVTQKNWELRWHESKTKIQSLTQKYELAQHQIKLYQREIDSYKLLIETYERQIQLKLVPESVDPMEVSKSSEKIVNPTMDSLLIQVQSTKERLVQLQEAYDAVHVELENSQNECSKAQAEVDRVRVKYGLLKDAYGSEKERRAVAEERAVHAEQLSGKGSFDAQKTRILHLTETPLVLALKEEVQVLKRQLEQTVISASTSSPSDACLAHSSAVESVVTPSIPNPEKLIQRLKENFKEQIGLFREGVYLMTGFKVDMLTNHADRPTFRLRSVYAENEDDQLLFQWPHDRKSTDPDLAPVAVTSLDLLNTELAKILAATPSYEYMSKFHSLPAFLASVQLSLFEKQTVIM